jgi:hypothetical protein
MSPEPVKTEVFAELPQRLRKSGTPPERLAVWIFSHRGETLYRVQSCRSEMVTNVAYQDNELYITDSGSGCILRARVAVAGKTLFSHL